MTDEIRGQFTVVEDATHRYTYEDDDPVPPFGWHLLVCVEECAPVTMSEDGVMRFALELAAKARMRVHGSAKLAPQAEWYGDGDCAGVTAVVPLDTSSIVVHAVDSTRRVHFEVWSCRVFEAAPCVEHAMSFFGGTVRTSRFVVT